MEFTIHRISLDIHSAKSQTTLRVKQADTNRKLHITLCEGGLPYHIAEDCYADFSALKADGNYIFNNCQIEGNTIEYTFTAQTTAAVGAMNCEITLYSNDGQRITSPRFTIIVEERVYNGEAIVSSPEANALDELINRAEHAVDNAESFVDSFNFRVNNTFANAFKRKVSGTAVQVDDVSPVEHIVGCKVRSKNLWNMSALKNTKLLTLNADGSVTVAASNYACTSENKLKEFCPSLKVGDVVTLSISTTGRPLIYLVGANVRIDRGTTITITEAMLNSLVTFYGAYLQDADYDVAHTVYSIQLEIGREATEYAPYVNPATATLTKCGKNLIPFFTSAYTYTYRNVVHTCDTISNTIKMNGTAEAGGGRTIFSRFAKPITLVKGVTYTLQARLISGVGANFHCYLTGIEAESKVIVYCLANNSTTFTATENIKCFVGVNQVEGITYENAVVQFQLEVGGVATSLETYRGEEHSVATDGTVSGMVSFYPNMTIFSDTANVTIDCEYNRDSNKVFAELYRYIEQGGITPKVARIVNVTILADKWVGSSSPYSQVVTVDGATRYSQVDLTPDAEQLAIFHNKDLAFVTENENGVVTVYAIGQKPTNDYTIQATVTEVNV